ncbi:MAG: hypothetical protein ACKVQT_30550 [Burkholderiales bacterium]
MKPRPKKHWHSAPIGSAAARELACLLAVQVTTVQDNPDGMLIQTIRIPPNGKHVAPSPASGGGQFCLVTVGQLVDAPKVYSQWSCIWVAHTDEAITLEAGAGGVEVLLAQCPRADYRPTFRPDLYKNLSVNKKRVRIDSADMRYGEQIFEVDVPLDGVDWSGPNLLQAVFDRFHARHETLYTYAMPGQEVVLVNACIAAIGKLPELPEDVLPSSTDEPEPIGMRRIHLGTWLDVWLYDFDQLYPGQSLVGSAVIEAPTTTVLLGKGDTARLTMNGWLDITFGGSYSTRIPAS